MSRRVEASCTKITADVQCFVCKLRDADPAMEAVEMCSLDARMPKPRSKTDCNKTDLNLDERMGLSIKMYEEVDDEIDGEKVLCKRFVEWTRNLDLDTGVKID
ncbi:hypothetical protein PHSY_006150 [Pseudozyma hubeiensis SY62]|uniref:Uncharacterized protein n=1 Tax=Pseudozyma hubeiensis (strain SY62) TaxID=1305764 RepID=R9PB03_PSEHS|nr:hypothetical protein PHSY_006150 [Pseudozyma hubeiensis SY62]GAC98556.1 hypothetical protein PHSY_006150 [Pseudozyma hubeiensis SY62]